LRLPELEAAFDYAGSVGEVAIGIEPRLWWAQADRSRDSGSGFATGAARLLTNLVLLRGGYPPLAVSPEDRPACTYALQQPGSERCGRLLYEDGTMIVWTPPWRGT